MATTDQAADPFSLIEQKDRAAVRLPRSLLRRVVRLDRGLGFFTWQVPHPLNAVIDRDRLAGFLDRQDLPPDLASRPDTLILIAEFDPALGTTFQARLRYYWRQFFHARVHLALDALSRADVQQRVERLGRAEFEEARLVLKQDGRLFHPEFDREVYVELAATYFELRFFAPDRLAITFPILNDRDDAGALLGADVDAIALLEATRPQPDMPPLPAPDEIALPPDLPATSGMARLRTTVVTAIRERALNFRRLGNFVRAALTRGAALGGSEARPDLKRLVEQLRPALGLTGEQERLWVDALEPLVESAAQAFRSYETRVLYDLQKLANDYPRELSVINPTEWLLWFGRVPLKRDLPLAREALLLRHLRDALRNLRRGGLPAARRAPLDELLTAGVHRYEQRLHELVTPRLGRAIDEAGLVPADATERLARETLVAEMADRVVSHGRLSFSDVRDSVSRHQLKLPDVGGPRAFVFGDELLKLDRRLALGLDGVYHRAEIYFRWLQTFSAFFFGTRAGRLLTLFVILPFGAAYLALAFLQHLIEPIAHAYHSEVDLVDWPAVLGLGVIVFALLHWAALRQGLWAGLSALGGRLGRLFPARAVLAPPPRPVSPRRGAPFYPVEAFVAALLVGLGFVALGGGRGPAVLAAVGTFLVVGAVLATRLGRWWRQGVGAVWEGLPRFVWGEVFVRFGRLIYDVFKESVDALEWFCYWLDEQVRFRLSGGPVWLAIKVVGSTVIAAVIYVLRFVVLLLLEPQINPLKHFPTVTVAHKVLLPLVPALEVVLAPHVGDAYLSWLLAFCIIASIPGIFGFFVWEMSSNWRLYEANRSPKLKSVRVGDHGEHLPNLLRPGLHSGTLPRLFAKWRRAEAADQPHRRREFQDQLHHVELEVRRFVQRALVDRLEQSPNWDRMPLEVGHIGLSTQRLRVELTTPGQPPPLTIDLEEDARRLVARVSDPGWLPGLTESQRQVLQLALAGWYKLAGVGVVQTATGEEVDYDKLDILWSDWVASWEEDAAGRVPRPLPHVPSLVGTG